MENSKLKIRNINDIPQGWYPQKGGRHYHSLKLNLIFLHKDRNRSQSALTTPFSLQNSLALQDSHRTPFAHLFHFVLPFVYEQQARVTNTHCYTLRMGPCHWIIQIPESPNKLSVFFPCDKSKQLPCGKII